MNKCRYATYVFQPPAYKTMVLRCNIKIERAFRGEMIEDIDCSVHRVKPIGIATADDLSDEDLRAYWAAERECLVSSGYTRELARGGY